jgi:hypothetical protein
MFQQVVLQILEVEAEVVEQFLVEVLVEQTAVAE